MKSDLIDIACKVRCEREKAIAVADGTMEGPREKWFWLPKSQVEVERGRDTDTVTMPEWLAKEKGLI